VKRREHGVNLDDGVALDSPDEYRLLYVSCRPEETAALQGWLHQDEEAMPLLVAGQIGTGKTTLIRDVLRCDPTQPIISLSLDKDPIEPTDGGFCGVLLGQVLDACLKMDISPDGCGLTVADFKDHGVDSWEALAKRLVTRPSSLSEASTIKAIYQLLENNADPVRLACGELMTRLEVHSGRRATVIAEGVDKFDPHGAEFIPLQNTLRFLGKWKTLFEINAAHLFRFDDIAPACRSIFVGGMNDDSLRQVFNKRLGSYAPVYQSAYELLTEYSGGNVRQGLRLLSDYYFRRTQRRNGHDASIALACHRVMEDLLRVSTGRFPVEVMNAVKKDGYAEGRLFSDRKTAEGAMRAIYRNWIVLLSEPDRENPTRWPAQINPLINDAIAWEDIEPPSAEELAVQKWAQQHDVSPIGLGCQLNVETGLPNWDSFWEEYNSSTSSEEDALGIVHLLEEIGAGLFGEERQDRIMVAYQDEENLAVIRDFLVGKANTYGSFPCQEIALEGGETQDPIARLLTNLANPRSDVIYSVHLRGAWTDSQLRDLERIRDVFGNLQMLWWVQQNALVRYLSRWPQLRQYFRFYEIESELRHGLSADEIETDIAFIEGLDREGDPEGVKRLRNVLSFLKRQGERK